MLKQTLLFIILSAFTFQYSYCCSCVKEPLCQFINTDNAIFAFEGKVIDTRIYDSLNIAVYIEVKNRIKDLPLATDTIKLYGKLGEATCDVNVIRRFPINQEFLIVLGQYNSNQFINNPDSLEENYWEYYPSLCSLLYLTKEGKDYIGSVNYQSSKYPVNQIHELLNYCKGCNSNPLKIYPNPSTNGNINIIVADYFTPQIEEVSIINVLGINISEHLFYNQPFDQIQLQNLENGIYFINIKTDKENCSYPIIINKQP